ncbi:SMEK domain-containing protein [Polaromonas sp. AET17H-212]|uniref:SMEK domain-containing protein n=1 Tax=Polaromonas sp. AET17H-212 TaxID=1977061 RepID=UPI000BBC6F63|nr:SMEK domain-containing protein [Polaromonas sp. AET17H-212]
MPTESIVNLAHDATANLAIYKYFLASCAKTNQLSAATFGEPFARDLLVLAFGYTDLKNLNLKKSFPAIDLASPNASIAFQVTLTGSSDKIIETQTKFFEAGLDKVYLKLKFVILGDKQTTYSSQKIVKSRGSFCFDPKDDIYDLNDLLHILVSEGDPEKFRALTNRLEVQIGALQSPSQWTTTSAVPAAAAEAAPQANLLADHLKGVFETHGVTQTDLLEPLRAFGVTRSIYADDVGLSDIASKAMLQFVADQFSISPQWLDGETKHIYSGGPGTERDTDWRRSLRGAYDFVRRVFEGNERLTLFLPAARSLRALDDIEDVVDFREPGYEHFFLVAQRPNAFAINRLRMAISDHLSYKPCRDGLFLLFLAVSLYCIRENKQAYIDVWEASRDAIRECDMGTEFLVKLKESGGPYRNNTDFIYQNAQGMLSATTEVPDRVIAMLQEELASVQLSSRQLVNGPMTLSHP